MKGMPVQDETEQVNAEIDLYDSDILALEKVFDALNASRLKATTVDGWRREIEERCYAAGFIATVVIRQAEYVELPDGSTKRSTGGQVFTSVTIVDRVNPEAEFDHERMRDEVRSNILGKNPQGDISTTKIFMPGESGMQRSSSGLIVPK